MAGYVVEFLSIMGDSPLEDRARVRKLLRSKLKTATAFDTFCQDAFPHVYRQFANGNDMLQRENLLLQLVELADIEHAFQQRNELENMHFDHRCMKKNRYGFLSYDILKTAAVSSIISLVIFTIFLKKWAGSHHSGKNLSIQEFSRQFDSGIPISPELFITRALDTGKEKAFLRISRRYDSKETIWLIQVELIDKKTQRIITSTIFSDNEIRAWRSSIRLEHRLLYIIANNINSIYGKSFSSLDSMDILYKLDDAMQDYKILAQKSYGEIYRQNHTEEKYISNDSRNIFKAAKMSVIEKLNSESIRKVIQDHTDEVKSCFLTALSHNPKLQGQVMTQFKISNTGTVLSVAIRSSSLKDTSAERCITSAIEKWIFPKPQDGRMVVINYPFVLMAQDDQKKSLAKANTFDSDLSDTQQLNKAKREYSSQSIPLEKDNNVARTPEALLINREEPLKVQVPESVKMPMPEYKRNILDVWYICIEAAGWVKDAKFISGESEHFATAAELHRATWMKIMLWKYVPQPAGFCYSHKISILVEFLPKIKIVPAILIKKEKLSGDDPHLPDVVKAQHRCQTLSGSYKVCIGNNGNVDSVEVLQGILGADEHIIKTLMTWRYKPQSIKICFVQFLDFQIDTDDPNCSSQRIYQPVLESQLKQLPVHDHDKCLAPIIDKWKQSKTYSLNPRGEIILRIELDENGEIYSQQIVKNFTTEVDRFVLDIMTVNPNCQFKPAISKDGKKVAFVIENYRIRFETD